MMDGILLVNKPIGMTSRDVVNILMKKFNTRKIGHTGTLDPFASGLLIITINKGTKISSFLEDLNKEYIAELKLGESTTTLDLEGEILEKKEVNLHLNQHSRFHPASIQKTTLFLSASYYNILFHLFP